LRNFPGPLLHRATRLTYINIARKGQLHHRLRALHARYGPVVRIAPNELAFNDERAWKEIYGHRIGAQGTQDENEKWVVAYAGTKNAPRSLLSAPRAEHAYLRRLLSHGFSDRSLKAQEGLIRRHVDLLVSQLRTVGKEGAERVNIKDWVSYTTFDIIGDLGFGAEFDCLLKPDHRVWTYAFSGPQGRIALQSTLRRMVLPNWLCDYIKSFQGFSQTNTEFQGYVRETVGARMQYTMQRPDLVEGLLLKEKEQVSSPPHLAS
jgi:cytochrome P450